MDETDKLRARIQGLRAKTLENGCTKAEALLAAAKVAELLDRYGLSLSDAEFATARCERRLYTDARNKRVPIGDCIGAIASFCDCRVWREKTATKEQRFAFFGLPVDVDAAHYLTEMIDAALRAELGRFKTSPAYRDFRHPERHLANTSFLVGMAVSIGDRLMTMKAERQTGDGRELVVIKTSVLDAELKAMNLQLCEAANASRIISADAYDAGEAAGLTMELAARKLA